MEKQNTVYAGLIKGRHELPTDTYIFDKIDDPTDFAHIYDVAFNFITTHCNIRIDCGRGINQESYTDIEIFHGTPLVVYVTGLSAALAAVIRTCAENGVPLTLMHYDRESDTYKPQKMFY